MPRPKNTTYNRRKPTYSRARPAPRRRVARPRPRPKPSAIRMRNIDDREESYISAPLQAIGGVLGMMAGGTPMSMYLGQQGGRTLAQGLKQLTGFGDYTVKKNVFSPGSPPSISNKIENGGAVCIRHREYIGDIISSSSANTFKIQSFDINPGLETTFTWLSQIASNFQEYEFQGLLFEFRTMSADALNSTNTALGQVIMATNYNSALPNFSSKAEMENSEFAQSIKPSESCVHLIECARSATVLSELYVRSGAVPANTDQRFYDLGNFQIATNGMQGTSVNVGELWVSYQVCLRKPLVFDNLGEEIEYAHFINNTGVTNAAPMGTSNATPTSGSSIACSISANGLVLSIPVYAVQKTYIVTWRWAGGNVVLASPGFSLAGGAAFNVFGGTGNSTDSPALGTTAGIYLRQNACVIPGGAIGTFATFTLTGAGTLPSANTSFECFVLQIPNTAN